MMRLATVLACAAMLGLASAPGASGVTRPVKVITHNIAGGYAFAGRLTAVDAAVRQARIWSPDVVMLQEVCEAQARVLRHRLPGYHYVFTVMRRNNPDCGDHGPHFGNVLASKWPLSGVRRINLRGDGHRKETEDVRYFKLTCASVAVSDTPAERLRACVTQLRAGHGKGKPWLDSARTQQVRRIHKALHDDITYRHVRVVVAGDFNARPQDPALDEMYKLQTGGGPGGPGDFHEADQTDHRYFFPANRCGPLACRSGELTCCDELPRDLNDPDPPLDRKYDYVFFSAPEVSQLSGRALALEPGRGGSDHVLYRATALFEF